LCVIFFIPETRRVSLEEMDVLFGGANHVEKGGDLLQVGDTHHVRLGQNETVTGESHTATIKEAI
jgi:hypothetical protein